MFTRLEAHGQDILHLTIIVGLCTFEIVSDFADFLTFLKFIFRELYITSLFFSKETESNKMHIVNRVMISYILVFTFDNLQTYFSVKSDTFVCLYFLFSFSNLNQSIYTYNYTRLAEVSICYALTTNDTKSGFYFYVYFFLFTPHGNFNVQKHTYTKEKQCKEKNKTKNKQTTPPPQKKKQKKKHFYVLFESVTGCKDSIPIFLFEEKKRGS